ncbi:MAG: helix-turn-helix domain-containing protein [Spirochaetota bacterium]
MASLTRYALKAGTFRFTIGKTRVTEDFHEHTHAYTELVVILGGTGRHIIDGNSYFVTSGDVYVFRGSASHGFTDVDALDMCNIGFEPAVLAPVDGVLRTLPGYQALFLLGPSSRSGSDFSCRLRLSLADRSSAERMIDRMIAEARKKEDGYEAALTALFTEFIVFLSRRYGKTTAASTEDVHRLAMAMSFLEREFRSDIRLNELAKRAGLSERQFLRAFRSHYQTTPIDYLLKLRVMHASRLLSSDAPITDIAYESGFSDSNYFTRQFKRVMGVSPREFRVRSTAI